MVVVAGGLGVVGISAYLGNRAEASSNSSSDGKSAKDVVIGIVFILIAELVWSFQYVFEESLLKKRGYLPAQTVGMEGFFWFGFDVWWSSSCHVLHPRQTSWKLRKQRRCSFADRKQHFVTYHDSHLFLLHRFLQFLRLGGNEIVDCGSSNDR